MRKQGIGYLPDMKNMGRTVEKLLAFYAEEKSQQEFTDFFTHNFGAKSESTLRLTQNTLVNYGLLEEKEDYIFMTTELGRLWLEKKSKFHLVRIIHEHIEYIGEMLLELQEKNLSGEQLIQRAKTYYEVELTSSDISRRAQLLKDAEMIKMNRRKIYVLTEVGAEFAKSLKLGNKSNTENKMMDDSVKNSEEVQVVEKPKDDDRILDYSRLMKMILKALDRAKSDPITKGELYIRDLYIILKNSEEIQKDLTPEDIETVLEFLSSPLVSCVRRQKNSEAYYVIDSIENVKKRLGIYIKSLG